MPTRTLDEPVTGTVAANGSWSVRFPPAAPGETWTGVVFLVQGNGKPVSPGAQFFCSIDGTPSSLGNPICSFYGSGNVRDMQVPPGSTLTVWANGGLAVGTEIIARIRGRLDFDGSPGPFAQPSGTGTSSIVHEALEIANGTTVVTTTELQLSVPAGTKALRVMIGTSVSPTTTVQIIGVTTGVDYTSGGATIAEDRAQAFIVDAVADPMVQVNVSSVSPGSQFWITALLSDSVIEVESIDQPVTVVPGSGTFEVDVKSVGGTPVTSPLPVSGTVTADQGAPPWTINLTEVGGSPVTSPLAISGTVAVSNFPATQPVSGTVTADQGAPPWSVVNDLPFTSLKTNSTSLSALTSNTPIINAPGAGISIVIYFLMFTIPPLASPSATTFTLAGFSGTINGGSWNFQAFSGANISQWFGDAGLTLDAATALNIFLSGHAASYSAVQFSVVYALT